MRIGIFSNAYRPLVSGVVNSIDATRRELLRQGHRAFVYAPRVRGYHDQHAGVYRFPSVDVTRRVQFPLPIPWSPAIAHQIKHARLEVLHTHHPALLGDYAWFWARRLGLPLVYTFHTQYEQYVHYVRWLPQMLLRAGCRWGVRQFTGRCDLVIAPSPAIRDLLDDYRIRTWTETLPNAIDLSRFGARRDKLAARRAMGWPEQGPIALYAGRIGKEKNLDFLLDAWSQVAEGHLVIVGDGAELDRLRSTEVPRVIFQGRTDYAQMPVCYAAADLFCMSSLTEVKPLVVLEALAAGLPVVAVHACGTSDTLTHDRDGLLIDLNRDQFASALHRVLEDDGERSRLSQGARRTAASYGMDAYVSRLLELYEEARRRRS